MRIDHSRTEKLNNLLINKTNRVHIRRKLYFADRVCFVKIRKQKQSIVLVLNKLAVALSVGNQERKCKTTCGTVEMMNTDDLSAALVTS